MSFIDQLMAARGLPVSNRLFGNNIGGTPQNISQQFLQRMGGTPPINPNPNLPSIPDGGYGAPIYRDLTASPNLLPTGTARRPVDIGLMGQERQSNVIPEFARVNAQSEASLIQKIKDFFRPDPLDINKLKSSIKKVETGGEKDPYIFTKVNNPALGLKPSSAFGPAQITYSLAENVLKNFGSEINKIPGMRNYVKDFIQQGKDSFNFQRIDKDKKTGKSMRGVYRKGERIKTSTDTYGISGSVRRGGKGWIDKAEHEKFYNTLFELALKEKQRLIRTAGGNPNSAEELSKSWYGGSTKKLNTDYWNKVKKHYRP
jgi:hypothetical protein